MLKKIGIALAVALPTCGWALTSGFYLGGGIGADTTQYDQTSYVTRPGSFNVINEVQLGAQGVEGTVLGGYGLCYKMLYLAGELNGTWSGANTDGSNKELISGTQSSTTYKINRYFGASVLPGVQLPWCTLLYGRVGYARGRFVINTTDISLPNTSQNLNGLRLGLGIDKTVWKNLSLRLEYSHIKYRTFSGTTFDPVGNVTKQTNIQPNANQFELDLLYRFC